MRNWEKGFYMNQKDLIYIKTIVDEGGISQAAKKLFVSQPSLSQSVKRIEESLGVPLFKRTPKGLVLTPEGVEYYNMAGKVLKIYDSFEDELKNMEELKTGTVFVGATQHRGIIALPKFLAEFHAKYPGIRVEIMEAGTQELENAVLCGKVDFALLGMPKQAIGSSQLKYQKLSKETFLILLPQGHSAGKYAEHRKDYTYPVLDPKWLVDENFLLPEPSMRLYENITSVLRKAGIEAPKSSYSSIYMESFPYLTAMGEGVSIVSSRVIRMHRDFGVDIYEIPEVYDAFWESSLVLLKDGYLSRAARQFIKEYELFLGI